MLYVIVAVTILAVIVLWCYMVRRELKELRQNVDNSAVQVQLNIKMKSCVKCDLEYKQGDKMLMLSLILYAQAARKYNNILGDPFYRPLALLMGFKKVSENV